jgi:hypothetical protein
LVAKMALVDALRLCDHPDDEDAVEGILMKLFKSPRISVQAAAAGYAAQFRTWGLASVPALELVTVADMVTAGVPIGHAITLRCDAREAVAGCAAASGTGRNDYTAAAECTCCSSGRFPWAG